MRSKAAQDTETSDMLNGLSAKSNRVTFLDECLQTRKSANLSCKNLSKICKSDSNSSSCGVTSDKKIDGPKTAQCGKRVNRPSNLDGDFLDFLASKDDDEILEESS